MKNTNKQRMKNTIKRDSKKRKVVETDTSSSPKKIKVDTEDIYFGNIPFDAKLEVYKPIFEEAGPVQSIDWKLDGRGMTEIGKFRGFCYVKYATKEAAEKAIKTLNGREVCGRALKVENSKGLTQNPPFQTIFVGNLPADATADEIKSFFAKYGAIKDIRMVNDRKTNAWKRTTFIDYEDLASAKKAYGAAPLTLRSFELRLDYASPLRAEGEKPSSAPGGGGRGGRGGARGGRGGGRGRGGR